MILNGESEENKIRMWLLLTIYIISFFRDSHTIFKNETSLEWIVFLIPAFSKSKISSE